MHNALLYLNCYMYMYIYIQQLHMQVHAHMFDTKRVMRSGGTWSNTGF